MEALGRGWSGKGSWGRTSDRVPSAPATDRDQGGEQGLEPEGQTTLLPSEDSEIVSKCSQEDTAMDNCQRWGHRQVRAC